MPYYCTVPRCTSMAGKAKNVSFHQFPRDEELAKLWNDILKRGKPYTKYSKVCSLHFTPEDYTITSVGKNKGQWRTLRKDAIPSQNLPSESPTPYQRKQWSGWNQAPAAVMDPSIQQQMAQAIYMQTMLAMQTSSAEMLNNGPLQNNQPHTSTDPEILKGKETNTEKTYKCTECSKCFKDPDVFILHKRTHNKNEKENFNMNLTLQANPILANLLKTNNDNIFDSTLTMENILMSALVNIREGYMRNLTSLIKNDGLNHDQDGTNDQMGIGFDQNGLSNDQVGIGFDQDGNSNDQMGVDFDQDGCRDQDRYNRDNGIDSDRNVSQNNRNDIKDNQSDFDHRNNLGVESTLGNNQTKFGHNNLNYDQNGDHNDSDSDSEYQNTQYYRKIRDGVNRYELSNTRGNSDNISDSKMYKSSCKGRYNGFDSGQNDSNRKDSVTSNDQICDSDLNESVDSDSLVIDETA